MADEPLLTLQQTAEQLGLPESTVRFYRDAFLDHVPCVGSGRRRRYPPAAVAVLRAIAGGYAAGKPRAVIRQELDGQGPPPGTTAGTARAAGGHGPREVSNLELLAAIVDGEREQRDALWQMAREIVRLTDVLDGQERLLGQIADQAALPREAAPPRAIGAGDVAPAWLDEPLPPPMPFVSVVTGPPEPAAAGSPAVVAGGDGTPPGAPQPAASTAPAAPAGGAVPDLERLRGELEQERELVERLRQAKVQLEHRVSDAEAELEERKNRKLGSVLDRILKTGGAG